MNRPDTLACPLVQNAWRGRFEILFVTRCAAPFGVLMVKSIHYHSGKCGPRGMHGCTLDFLG